MNRREWIAALSLGAAATACRMSPPEEQDSSPATPLTEAQKGKLKAVMEEAITRQVIPGGSLLVRSRGQVVIREAFGLADLESRRPFTLDAPCHIASLSKPIVSTFFVMLDERGVVSLDAPVEKYLPEFKGVRVKGQSSPTSPPLVWQLLSHRAGLPGNADMGENRPQRIDRAARASDTEAAPVSGLSLAEVVSGWAREGLLAEPGTRFAYGSAGYMVGARIVEVATGQPFERLLKEWLFDPLGMTHTTYRPDARTEQQVPTRYLRTRTGLEPDTRVRPELEADGLVNPAGGLCSTLDDVGQLLALHLNRGMVRGRRLVAAESLARMYQPHPPRPGRVVAEGEEDAGYGLGWNIMPGGFVRHLGASGTLGWLDVNRQHAGVLLTQTPWGNNKSLITRLMQEVRAIFPNAPTASVAGRERNG